MSNHFSAANLQHPGDDPRLDLTDLFVFTAPDDPDRTVLIMDSNPFMKGTEFNPDAVYRFNIDNDGDALPASFVQLHCSSEPDDGHSGLPPLLQPVTTPGRVNRGAKCSSRPPRWASMPWPCRSRPAVVACSSAER